MSVVALIISSEVENPTAKSEGVLEYLEIIANWDATFKKYPFWYILPEDTLTPYPYPRGSEKFAELATVTSAK